MRRPSARPWRETCVVAPAINRSSARSSRPSVRETGPFVRETKSGGRGHDLYGREPNERRSLDHGSLAAQGGPGGGAASGASPGGHPPGGGDGLHGLVGGR